MNREDPKNLFWVPKAEEDKDKVRKQVSRLLESSFFKNSHRYPLLLQFIVEETLQGRGETLKERLLGVRVFDRPADYDTAADPIVRVTIAEIRKRIAQYYHEPAHRFEMRIELRPGKYIPEFYRADQEPSSNLNVPKISTSENDHVYDVDGDPHAANGHVIAELQSTPAKRPARLFRLGMFVGVAVLLLAGIGSFSFWRQTSDSALEEFWHPLMASHRTVIFCLPVGGIQSGLTTGGNAGILVKDPDLRSNRGASRFTSDPEVPETPTFLAHQQREENVVFSDALATLHSSNFFAAHRRDSVFHGTDSVTLDDLRQGPVVLIGGVDNQWTLRALASLRYRFAGTHEEQYWIVDTKNPTARNWGLDLKVPLYDIRRDFAIIARIHDASIGVPEVIVAGISMSGTTAAGEFLVDPQELDELRRRVGKGYRDRDFEAILSTDVVNGIPGNPRILTVAVQ